MVAWVGSVRQECTFCTVLLGRWIFKNFKLEFLLNGKCPGYMYGLTRGFVVLKDSEKCIYTIKRNEIAKLHQSTTYHYQLSISYTSWLLFWWVLSFVISFKIHIDSPPPPCPPPPPINTLCKNDLHNCNN